MSDNNIEAKQYVFRESCHTVGSGGGLHQRTTPSDLVKNICFINEDDEIIVAIVNGEDRASASRIAKALNIAPPRVAARDILVKTGYLCGGSSPFRV